MSVTAIGFDQGSSVTAQVQNGTGSATATTGATGSTGSCNAVGASGDVTCSITVTSADTVGSNDIVLYQAGTTTLDISFTVDQVPAITSEQTFTVGQASSYTVTATGTPTPSLTESGALPSGVTFKDDGNGSGTLSVLRARGRRAR